MAKGRGRIYQRGSIWWIQFSLNGKDIRETTNSDDRAVAEKLLTKRMAAKDAGTLQASSIKRLRFEDLQAILEGDYQLNDRKTLDRVQGIFRNLGRTFAGWFASAITEAHLTKYANDRIAEGRTRRTAQYELSILQRAYHLARIPSPPFPSIEVDNTRKGFFERQEFGMVTRHLPPYLRPVMTFACLTGWRTQSEVLPLQWKQVDFKAGTIRLEPGTTKNKDGRTFPFQALPELADLLKQQWESAQQIQAERSCIVPWVFFRVTKHDVRPIKSYRGAWGSARKKAGMPDKLVHDLRRTTVRSLERASVPRSVAMKLTGHKTEAVYRRYAIVSEADLSEGVKKLATMHANESQDANNGTIYGTVKPIRSVGQG